MKSVFLTIISIKFIHYPSGRKQKPLISAKRKGVRCLIYLWWRRRESNPRPKTFHNGIYILSPNFRFRLYRSPPGTIPDKLSHKIFTYPDAGVSGQAILQVDALIGSAGWNRQDTSLKRLERIHNHLRLCYFPPV